MNALSVTARLKLWQPRMTDLVQAARSMAKVLLAHVRETLSRRDRTHDVQGLAGMNARLLQDIGVEAAWQPSLFRELQYPRL